MSGSITDELLGTSTAAAPAMSAPSSGSITDELLGTGSNSPEPVSGDQLTSDPSKAVGLKERFASGFSSNPQETTRYYAQSLYPNEPIEQAAKRFGMTEDGRLYHRADDGKMYDARAVDGIGGRVGAFVEGASAAIPAVTGAAAGIATAPLAATGVGLLATAGAASGAAGAGEYVRQKAGDFLLGDAADNKIDKLRVAKEAAFSGVGQVIGAGVGKYFERLQARDIGRMDPKTTAKAYAEAKKQGVSITPGQATGLKTLQAGEKRLATRVPETIDQMDDFLRQQGDDVANAWYKQLDKVAPMQDAEATGKAVRSAAQSSVDDIMKARATAAKPLYEKAFGESGPIDTADVLTTINEQLKKAAPKGATERALNAAKSFITDETGKPITDLQRLHNARIEIGNIIDTREAGGTPLNNTIVGGLKQVKGALTDAMDSGSAVDAASGRPLYKAARGTYSEMSDDVDDVLASALKRIADMKDANILSTAREAFNPNTRSPEMIAKLRGQLASKDPEAWQSLKRLWLQDEVSDALKVAQKGEVINPAGKILAVLDNPGTKRSLNAALSSSERAGMDDLKFIMRRIASANMSMGSDTVANQMAEKAATEQATAIWARGAKTVGTAIRPWVWGDKLAEASAERNMRRQAGEMVKLVTSGDPKALQAIKDLRKLTPGQWRGLAASGQLATQVGPSAVSGAAGLVSGDKRSPAPDRKAN